MTLELSYDLVCPFCFVGLTRLLHAVEAAPAAKATVELWPFQLLPDIPAAGVDQRAHFSQRFGEDRVAGIYARMESMAAAEGLIINYEKMKILPNTRQAHLSVDAVEPGPKRLELAVALATAHFSEGRNIGDPEVLQELAEPYLDGSKNLRAHWSSDIGDRRMGEARDRANRLGIRGVPHFVIDGRAIAGTPTPEELTRILA